MNAVLQPLPYRELLLGAGNSRIKRVQFGKVPNEFQNVTALDIDAASKPDVVWDLNTVPLPFENDSFDEIHAYDVMEHCGRQGDWRFFFAQFQDLWRIMKSDGYLCATCPMWDSPWAWSDPGHSRVLSRHSLAFLSQAEYADQIGRTQMTDYRHVYAGNFETVAVTEDEHQWGFVLKALK